MYKKLWQEKITKVNGTVTDNQKWWTLCDESAKLVYGMPQQCAGSTFSPLTMLIGDTKEEVTSYIEENELTYSNP